MLLVLLLLLLLFLLILVLLLLDFVVECGKRKGISYVKKKDILKIILKIIIIMIIIMIILIMMMMIVIIISIIHIINIYAKKRELPKKAFKKRYLKFHLKEIIKKSCMFLGTGGVQNQVLEIIKVNVFIPKLHV